MYHNSMPTTNSEDIRLKRESSLSDNDLSLSRGKLGDTKSGRDEVNLGGRSLDKGEDDLCLIKIVGLVHSDSEVQAKRNHEIAQMRCKDNHTYQHGEDVKSIFARTNDNDSCCSDVSSQQTQNSQTPNQHKLPFPSVWFDCQEHDDDSFVKHLLTFIMYLSQNDAFCSLFDVASFSSNLLEHLQLRGNSFAIFNTMLARLDQHFRDNEKLLDISSFCKDHDIWYMSGLYDLSNYAHLRNFLALFDGISKEEINGKNITNQEQKCEGNTYSKRKNSGDDNKYLKEYDGHIQDAPCEYPESLDSRTKKVVSKRDFASHSKFLCDAGYMKTSNHDGENWNLSKHLIESYTISLFNTELQQRRISSNAMAIIPERWECLRNLRHHTDELRRHLNTSRILPYSRSLIEVAKGSMKANGDGKSTFLIVKNSKSGIEVPQLIIHSSSGKYVIEALNDTLEAIIDGEEMYEFGNLIPFVSDILSVSELHSAFTFNLCQALLSNIEKLDIVWKYDSLFLDDFLLLPLCHEENDERIFSEIFNCFSKRSIPAGFCRKTSSYVDLWKLRTSYLEYQRCTNCLLLNNSRKTYSSPFINSFLKFYGKGQKSYHPQLHLNPSIFISVALGIINRGIIIDTDHLHIFETDLTTFETHSIQLFHHPKFRAIRYLLLESRTRHVLQNGDASSVSRDETAPRKTLIIPYSLQTQGKTNEQHYDSVCETHKIPLYTLKNENRNDIGKLLNESLMQIESMSFSKRFSSKSIMDLQISQLERHYIVCPVLRNCLDYTFEQIVAGANHHSQDIMRFEMQRFASFAKYNYPDTPSAFDFAKAGWYATGLGKETACFICNIKFSEWRKSLKPFDVHVQLSPECPFIKGEDVEAVNVDRTIHSNVNGHTDQSTRSAFESLTNGVEQINLTETNGSATCLQPHGFTYNTSSTPQNEYQVNGFSYSPYRDTPSIPPPIRDQTDNFSNGHQLNGFRNPNGDSTSNGQLSVDNPSRSSIYYELLHDSSNGISSWHFNGHSRSHSDMPHYGNHLQQNNNHFVPFTADLLPQRQLPMDPTAPENDHGYLLPPPISVFSTPKFPAYHPLSVRISSYQGFPSHTGQSPRVLAQAGMFYRGYSDRCSCFWCGIGLQNWSTEDDPWVEHARWSPRCQYLIDAKGEEFIALVQESYRQEDPVFPELNDDDTMIAELQSMGFSTESIQSAIKTLKSNRRNVNLHIVANFILENMLTVPQAQANENNLPKSDHPSKIGKKEDPYIVKANNAPSVNNENSHDKTNSLDENSKSMYEETTAMKEQLTCKVCMDSSVSVVFLPCGHIVACGVCSVRLSKCPICRKFIREKVKTLMS